MFGINLSKIAKPQFLTLQESSYVPPLAHCVLLQYSRIDFNATDQAGQTGLYAAIGEGKIDVVKVLIHSEKIDFNATDALGMTPLHWSCFYHYSNISPRIYEDIVKLLLQLENINVNATDMKGRTPEDLAKLREFHGITKILNQKLNR